MLTSGAPHQQMGHPGQYPGQAEGQPGPQQAVYGKKSSGQSDLMKVTAQSTTISVSGFSSLLFIRLWFCLSLSSVVPAPLGLHPSPPALHHPHRKSTPTPAHSTQPRTQPGKGAVVHGK